MTCLHLMAPKITRISSPSDFFTESSAMPLALIWECNECGKSMKYLREDLVEEEIKRQLGLRDIAIREEDPHV